MAVEPAPVRRPDGARHAAALEVDLGRARTDLLERHHARGIARVHRHAVRQERGRRQADAARGHVDAHEGEMLGAAVARIDESPAAEDEVARRRRRSCRWRDVAGGA
jgi:hypothetical protein